MWSLSPGLPQSNQRGIEIRQVGFRGAGVAGPQSNQRGIEIWLEVIGREFAGEPQSNQRGIEIGVEGDLPDLLPLASIEPAWD